MSYVLDNWSYDPFLIVVGVIVVLHELGLRNLTTPLATRTGTSPSPQVASFL